MAKLSITCVSTWRKEEREMSKLKSQNKIKVRLAFVSVVLGSFGIGFVRLWLSSARYPMESRGFMWAAKRKFVKNILH